MMAQRKSPEGIQYSGFFDALLKIPRQEGMMALYKVREHSTLSLSESERCSERWSCSKTGCSAVQRLSAHRVTALQTA